MCSYFTHFADNKAQEDAAARPPDPLLQGMRDPGAARAIRKPRRRATAISSTWSSGCSKVKPEDLTENSVLLGSSARITETLKKVEAAGFDEVILYFNVGLKPHGQVKDEMARFMAEVGARLRRRGEGHAA